MNELQIGLLGFGACAVAGVFLYNRWQEVRQRKMLEKELPPPAADPLFAPDALPAAAPPADEHLLDSARLFGAAGRIEPALQQVAPEEIASPAAAAPAPEFEPAPEIAPPADPAASAAAPEAPEKSHSGANSPPADLLAPHTDCIAVFTLARPVAGAQVLLAGENLIRQLAKPLLRAGINARNGDWEEVNAGATYSELCIGLQLADRRGPLGEADLLLFHGAMFDLASELMGSVSLPPQEETLQKAIALDRNCAELDIQISINVIALGDAFAGTQIRALAESSGMVLDSSGRFVRCDDVGRVLYTLANQEVAAFTPEGMKVLRTHGIVFLLDVPRAPNGERAFAQMLSLAHRMAEALGGTLADDNRRPLSDATLDPFRRQVGQYQAQLAARHLPAGERLALRIFS